MWSAGPWYPSNSFKGFARSKAIFITILRLTVFIIDSAKASLIVGKTSGGALARMSVSVLELQY